MTEIIARDGKDRDVKIEHDGEEYVICHDLLNRHVEGIIEEIKVLKELETVPKRYVVVMWTGPLRRAQVFSRTV